MFRSRVRRFSLCTVLLFLLSTAVSGAEDLIHSVSVSRGFFNPSIKERVEFSFAIREAGIASVSVLDRDGYPIRQLVSRRAMDAGIHRFSWDGRDATGQVVPDEAYSVRIDLTAGEKRDSYFPANRTFPMFEVQPKYFDRRQGVIAYELSKPSRIHLQAGTSKVDGSNPRGQGPVLKTLVNREPRASGVVVEQWAGFDESGTINVPDLPDFVLAIAATALPENSVITIGNRNRTFLETISDRKGTSLITFPVGDHRHHQGLTSLEDTSPALILEPLNATWSAREGSWQVHGQKLRVRLSLSGPSATTFVRRRGTVMVFVDGKKVSSNSPKGDVVELDIPIKTLTGDAHVAAVNWVHPYGPVAVNSFRFHLTRRHQNDSSSKEAKP